MRRSLLVAAVAVVIVLIVVAYFAFTPGGGETKASVLTLTATSSTYPLITEYSTRSSTTAPNGIAVDSNGTLWYVLNNLSALAQFSPTTGAVHEYLIPLPVQLPVISWGVVVDNQRGLVWFTEQESNAIWSFNVRTTSFKEYRLPTQNSFPFGIAIDQQGNVWFAEIGNNRIGEITTSGSLQEFVIPAPDTRPAAITVDSSGTVWVTLSAYNGTASFKNGVFHVYNLSGKVALPDGIVVDSQGNVWITEHGPPLIAEFNPTTGSFKSYSTALLPPPFNSSYPYFDYVDQSGNVWFNEHYGNAVARLNPETGTLTEFVVPTKVAKIFNISGSITMCLTANGTPWFTEYYSGKIGTVTGYRDQPLNVSIQGDSGLNGIPISLSSTGSATVSLTITSQEQGPLKLLATVGNFTGFSFTSIEKPFYHFRFAFSPPGATGNFSDTLTITGNGTPPGVYFVTIGAASSNVVVSRLVELVVS